ncbi:MAG: transglutaminase domain-containing protein [Candidatus Eisenbacteria bacterium]|nr:transglutaminase domain-containing protein [Candidatus Eisenbacteria bacterium]
MRATPACLAALGLIATALSPAVAADASPEPPRGVFTPGVWSSLDRAGENAHELLRALSLAPDEDRDAVRFLVESLPSSDLAAVDAAFLLETAALAREARERFPWGREVPEEVYLRCVLAPRVSQEPLERWRRFLLDEIGPRLEGLTTMTDAALEVNRWCGERVTFKPTERRDQGVFETLAAGYGRCEELVILHASALRSVCVPARQVWTPYWPTMDNNHAWTEVWADGGWHYTGACEPGDALDDAWFNDAARNAALVLSPMLGSAAPGEDAYRTGERHAIVNSTARYTGTGALEVLVTADGAPSPSVPVTVSLWNFGAVRAIARLDTDEEGRSRIELGDGDYVVCAGGPPRGHDWRVARVARGETAVVGLDLSRSPGFAGEFELRYDHPGEAPR